MPKSRAIRDWQARLDAATRPLPAKQSTWVEDPNSPSGWTWRPPEPPVEATHLLPAYRRHELREPAMTQNPDSYDSVSRDVYDPDIGSDGGGRFVAQAAEYDHPVDYEEPGALPDPLAPDIVVCDHCGSAVSRDRLR